MRRSKGKEEMREEGREERKREIYQQADNFCQKAINYIPPIS